MAFNPNARLDPTQVEDRRGRMGRAGPIAVGGGGLGILGLIIALLLGIDPFGGAVPSNPAQPAAVQPAQPAPSVEECRTGQDADRRADCRIVGYVNSIQAFWADAFGGSGLRYQPARTVLFSGATQAGCGFAEAAQGPFYCPADQQIYLDLTFFGELQQRFGARGGPFAEAYVLAHEYGHHVQNLLGILRSAGGADSRAEQRRGADRAAGGLPGRHLGPQRHGHGLSAAAHRGGHRGRRGRRRRGGGRPHPAPHAGPGDAGVLDARLLPAAPAGLRQRLHLRQRRRLPRGLTSDARRHARPRVAPRTAPVAVARALTASLVSHGQPRTRVARPPQRGCRATSRGSWQVGHQ